MKRITFLVCMLAVTAGLYSQKGKVAVAESLLSTNDVEGARKAIDEALVNEKSNTWPKTFIVAGKVYAKTKDEGAAFKALEFFQKARELDQKGDEKGKGIGRYDKELTLALTFFKSDLTNVGVGGFEKERYDMAFKAFEGILSVNEMAGITAIDTTIIYNCALAAYNDKNWEQAEKYFQKTISYNYAGGDAILLLHQVFTTTNDSVKMAANLKNGFEKYPNDDRILTTLINYYLSSRQNQEALAYLNKAIEKDPNNPSFYYARGVLHDQSKNFDAAQTDYNKCIEIDSNYFNALYNLGVMFYNKGVERNNQANELTDMKAFNKARDEANGYFKSSLPFMEKAYTVIDAKEGATASDKISVLESLKSLYYRFDDLSNYNRVNDLINSMR
ncbi:TPR repeat protein [Breznakibacter xylanolyticus]|uniref:TPR repeat protein n=1 Tax=Breznakibacter xylanolyticus TaxID=990 RepID=A0A2W7NF43_9BACT|nr:tetratricopeptide repeat protein [Breznakibacter xylanolyticus]PZX15344.1 TPR repeat protein [Breznakibacter xylanolyticus]